MSGTYRHIYLDFHASTPTAPEVVEAIRMVLEEPYGNPSSGHWAGSPAREAVDKARMQVAGLLGCKTNEIVFTSGGSEANNHALYPALHRDSESPYRHTPRRDAFSGYPSEALLPLASSRKFPFPERRSGAWLFGMPF